MCATISVSPKKDAERDLVIARPWLSSLNRGWSRCADSRAIAYTFFAFAYIIPNIILARHKLIWDDEFFTLYLSKTASWSELWRALSPVLRDGGTRLRSRAGIRDIFAINVDIGCGGKEKSLDRACTCDRHVLS